MTGRELREKTDEAGSHYAHERFHGDMPIYNAMNAYRKGALNGPPIEFAIEALEFYAKHHHWLPTTSPNFAREALVTLKEARQV